MGNCKSTN